MPEVGNSYKVDGVVATLIYVDTDQLVFGGERGLFTVPTDKVGELELLGSNA